MLLNVQQLNKIICGLPVLSIPVNRLLRYRYRLPITSLPVGQLQEVWTERTLAALCCVLTTTDITADSDKSLLAVPAMS